MAEQVPLDENSLAEQDKDGDGLREIAPDIAYRRLTMVNVVFLGTPGHTPWVLVDAGLPGNAGRLRSMGQLRMCSQAPNAIILTHGHFDHVGSLLQLAEEWNVPIYAHPLEHPYLNGTASYPPPDPSVGGGAVALLSPLLPRSPLDVSRWLQPLPENGEVPFMPDWRWIHTPGHTPGHVSLWREADGSLVAGDAFVTTRQESAYAVAVQDPEMHGPPQYFTQDWTASAESVRRLAALRPQLVITGHGRAMQGPEMLAALDRLATNFEEIAVPPGGRYVRNPARVADGSAYAAP
jgi:glyoxylase-like metal-dependent hydrolase (beta-lactamase superfamily II)